MPPHLLRTLAAPAALTIAIVLAVAASTATVPTLARTGMPPAAHSARALVRTHLAATADDPAWIVAPVGQFGGAIGAMAADDRAGGDESNAPPIVWLGRGPRVEAVRLDNPAAPALVGRSTWLGGTVVGLAVDGGLGVATLSGTIDDTDSELVTLDVRDPARPAALGRTPLERWAGDVEVAGGFAYATHQHATVTADGRTRSRYTIAVVDVRSPAAPALVTPDAISAEVEVVDLRVVGGLLAVTVTADDAPDGGEPVPQLRLYDLADPSAPALVGTLDDTAMRTLGDGPGVRDGRRVYACGGRSTVVAVDVADPRAPRIAQRWSLEDMDRDACDLGSIGGALQIDANGTPFGVFGWSFGAVALMGAPPDPTLTLSVQLLPNTPTAAAMLGRHVVAADVAGNVTVVDSDVLVHRPHGYAIAGTLAGIGEVAGLGRRNDVDDGRLYAMQRYDGLHVLSLDDPRRPTTVERVKSDGVRGFGNTGLSIFGGFAVAALDPGCLDCSARPADVFDLRAPGPPRSIGRIADGGRTWLMTRGDAAWAIHGGASWRGTYRYRLAITPLALLDGPAVATFTPDHDLKYGAVVGDRFIAIGADPEVEPGLEPGHCTPYALEVWDLREPARPRRASRVDLPVCLNGYYTRMLLVGDVLYIAAGFASSDDDSSLIVLQLQPDGSARELGRTPLPGAGSALAVDDGRLFVQMICPFDPDRGCIDVIDVRTPGAPRSVAWLRVGADSGQVVARGNRVYVVDDSDGGVWVFEPPLEPPHGTAYRLALPWLAREAAAPGGR